MNIDELNRLAELEILSGQLETMEEFAELYQFILEEVQAIEDKGQRQAGAKALQKIMLKQTEFLFNAWLRERRTAPMRLSEDGKNN